MQTIERNGYTREEIISALHAERNSRNVRFRYDLLDKDGRFKRSLSGVMSGEVSFSAFSTIKRTAKFKINEKIIPEYIDREEDSNTWNQNSGFTNWSHSQTTASGTKIEAVTFPATTVPSWDMESFTSGIATGWEPWVSSRGNMTQAVNGGIIGHGQNINKTDTANVNFGMQTTAKNLLATFADSVIRVTFFYKRNGHTNHPNYVFALANDGLGNLSFNANATYTEIGSGWWRYESWVNAGRATSWGLLIGVQHSGALSWTIDNVLYNRFTQDRWAGEATSSVIDLSDGTSLGLDVSRAVSSTVTWTRTQASWNSAQIGAPLNQLQSRYSLNGGSTWSSWVNQTSGAGIAGLPSGSSIADLRVQFRWQFTRYRHTDIPSLDSLSVSLTYEKDYVVPESTEIDYLTDRIQPFMELRMPDGGWVDYPLGVFLLSTPVRVDENNRIYREIEAYDGLIILDEDRFTGRYHIPSGTNYLTAVDAILRSAGITQIALEETTETLTTAREFAIGTSKLEAVNELLQAVNFTSLWVDSDGFFRASPYRSPTERAVEYVYQDDQLSILHNGMEEELDLFSVANTWVLTESNPEKTPKVAVRQNNNPNSPTSTVSLGRVVTDFRELEDVASQTALNNLADRIMFEASQIFGKLKFETALVPFHEYMDVIRVKYAPLKIDFVFTETNWTMKLEAGGLMEHEARRVVVVDES